MRIFISGGAGFIGSHVAKRCIELGHKVFIVDNLSTGKIENLPSSAGFLEMGAESQLIEKEFATFKPQVVFHIGGQSSGQVSEENPLLDLDCNSASTLNLLRLSHAYNIEKFVYASSMSCYGNSILPSDNKGWNEDSACSPTSIYGVNKINSENYLKLYSKRGIKCLSLRMFNVYGPGQNMSNLKQGMLSIYLQQILEKSKVSVKGSLERKRDFVYISDVVNAWMLTLLHSPKSNFEIFNICTGDTYTIADTLQEIQKHCNPFKIEILPGTPGDQLVVVGNPNKANHELNWHSKTSLSYGLQMFSDFLKVTK
jgi:UDP-glucose 4-epimerase